MLLTKLMVNTMKIQENLKLIFLKVNQIFRKLKNYYSNHNFNKILKSDWFSTALISALIGQFNRTVRVMPK